MTQDITRQKVLVAAVWQTTPIGILIGIRPALAEPSCSDHAKSERSGGRTQPPPLWPMQRTLSGQGRDCRLRLCCGLRALLLLSLPLCRASLLASSSLETCQRGALTAGAAVTLRRVEQHNTRPPLSS